MFLSNKPAPTKLESFIMSIFVLNLTRQIVLTRTVKIVNFFSTVALF